MLNAETIERVLASGLDYLRVSVYGGNEDAFARRTNTPAIKLARVISNVAALRKRRDEAGLSAPFIYVKMIDTSDPAENAQFLDTFRPLADEVAIEPVMNWNDPDQGNLAQLSRDEMLATPYFRHTKRVCAFPFYTLVVHSDLRVSICCVDWAKQAVVGDLKTETLRRYPDRRPAARLPPRASAGRASNAAGLRPVHVPLHRARQSRCRRPRRFWRDARRPPT